VRSGLAHLCNEPFAAWHPWGSWRQRRNFVGRVGYGCRYLLWNPVSSVHRRYPAAFRDLVSVLLLARPRDDCPISWMSDDVLFYILNMCRHDWCKAGPLARRAVAGGGGGRLPFSDRIREAVRRSAKATQALLALATI